MSWKIFFLFSAHAEVFPIIITLAQFLATLLRARGGISAIGILADSFRPSSPRTWRYFLRRCPLRTQQRWVTLET